MINNFLLHYQIRQSLLQKTASNSLNETYASEQIGIFRNCYSKWPLAVCHIHHIGPMLEMLDSRNARKKQQMVVIQLNDRISRVQFLFYDSQVNINNKT